MKTIKDVLSDGFWIMPSTPQFIENGEIPYITSKNIKISNIDFSNVEYISKEDFEEISKNRPIKVNDMLISMIGTLGNIAIVKETDGSFYGQNMYLLRLNSDVIDRDYFYHFFNSDVVKRHIESRKNKSTQGYLKANHIEEIAIPVPSMEEQKEIASHFEAINSLIDARKEQLEKLDLLVKSQFIELFGDYDLSHAQSGWKAISEIGRVVGGATPKTNIEEYWDGEYRWITPAELVADNGYIYDSVRKLTKAGVDSCSLQEMPVNTVILSSRAPIGKVAIAGNTFYCNQGFKNIVCNESIIPRYLYTILLLNTEYLNSLGRGATFKEISKSIVENIKIPVPSVELQEQFTTFVEQTDKSKLAVQQSLEKFETLKKSLMQQYFG